MRPDPLITRVRRTIVGGGLLIAGAPVVVGVSGGADSLCLLDILDTLREHLGVTLHVAHLDHQLRGEQSAEDAQFVAAEAQRRGLPVTVAAADIAAIAAAQHGNQYAVGRGVRYAFLACVACAIGAQAVAVAHHADDQAETVLMHLLRGAGPEGLAGMRHSTPFTVWQPEKIEDDRLKIQATPIFNLQSSIFQYSNIQSSPNLQSSIFNLPNLLRPLLDEPRSEIERYCEVHGLAPRHDPSNDDTRHLRARVRAELLPLLKEYNPQVIDALGRSAAISADEHALAVAQLDAIWPQLAHQREGAIDLDGALLWGLHPALQRAALRRAHTLLVAGPTLSFRHVEAARALAGRGVGGRTEWPGGIAVTLGYDSAVTIGTPRQFEGPQLPEGIEQIVLGREASIALQQGWRLLVGAAECAAADASKWEAFIDADAIGGDLIVRRRRTGDRVRPAGGRGTRRLQDVFVDARIPQSLRAAWPIVATEEQVVWVVGVCIDAEYIASSASRRVMRAAIETPQVENT